MSKNENAREFVRSIVYSSMDRLRSRGYYQEEIYIILLALYAYKTKDDRSRGLVIMNSDVTVLVGFKNFSVKKGYQICNIFGNCIL